MLANYVAFALLVGLKLSIATYHRPTITNHDTIISLSAVLGSRLTFSVDDVNSKTITWYKGVTDLTLLISNAAPFIHVHGSISARYHLANQTQLTIAQTTVGDEGFYTLTVDSVPNTTAHYLYHVVLFIPNLSLSISSPSPKQHVTYRAEQQINVTCSVSFHADRSYIEQSRSVFLSTWYMILYNNDPDQHRIFSLSLTSYMYTASLVNYELNRNDHHQRLSCTLFQQDLSQVVILNTMLMDAFNIEYKAYLRGNYYFTRSFNSYSAIEINCEEFEANPRALYTLIWMLNGRNQTLLNQTKHGRYLIENATWHHRGNYMCFAENYLNEHQPVHQLFRLNVWLTTYQSNLSPQIKVSAWQRSFPPDLNRSLIFILLIVVSAVAGLFFVLSLYYFCARAK